MRLLPNYLRGMDLFYVRNIMIITKREASSFLIMVICQNQRKDSWHKMRDCILISIKPVYAEAILNGVKTVEYRRCHFSSVIRKMLIYETSPLQKIVGEVFVREIIYESPDYIW